MKGMPIAAAIVLAACGGTRIDYIPLNVAPHPATPKEFGDVPIFMSKAPERPFVEVGAIESQQSSVFSTDNADDIIRQMRLEAGKRGCDGLILVGSNDSTKVIGSVSNGSGNIDSTTLKGYRGTCIMYKDDGALVKF